MLLKKEDIEAFEAKYKISIVNFQFNKFGETFQCHLDSDFGELPVEKTDIVKRDSESYPYEAVAYIWGIKFFYLISEEDC